MLTNYKTTNEGYVFPSHSTMTYLLPWQSHWKAKKSKGCLQKNKYNQVITLRTIERYLLYMLSINKDNYLTFFEIVLSH